VADTVQIFTKALRLAKTLNDLLPHFRKLTLRVLEFKKLRFIDGFSLKNERFKMKK
jgi:hypothetical protein